MKALNPAVEAIPPSGIRRFFDLAAGRPDVISLGVGEPDFVTPWHIREAAIYAIERGRTTYTPNAGLPELREAIALAVQRYDGVSYCPDTEVIVTVGVSEGLDLALRTIVAPGDEVLLFEPCYVSYGPNVQLVGGVPVAVPTSAEDGFQIDPRLAEARITPRTKAMLICSPNNPTGVVQSAEVLRELVEIAVRHDLYIISDEIYSRLVFEGERCCVASLAGAWERTVLLNGLSKSHAMTGWRVGYLCAPARLTACMLKVHQYTALCAPHVSQVAAIEALHNGDGESSKMLLEYRRRRDYFVREMHQLGFPCAVPQGAFYVFPSIRSSGLTSEEFAQSLLTEAGVAVVPGNVFGASGEGHIRCSIAASFEVLEQAVGRMHRFVETRRSDCCHAASVPAHARL